MKKIIFAFCLLGLVSISIIAQPLTEEQKQKLISSLDSSDYGIKMAMINKIAEENIIEAIPKIEQRFWNQDPYMQYKFLNALWRLNAPSTFSFARSFYDSTDTFKNHKWHSEDPLIMKVWATAILFTYGDHSKTSVVFDLLNRDSTKIDFYARHLLRLIIENVPEYAAAAKEQLIKIALHADGSDDRWRSFIDLVQLYGSGASDVLVNVARNDKEPVNRYYALFLLGQVDYSLGHILLLERLKTEPGAAYHWVYTDTLLLKYGRPLDYKTVKECQQIETDATTKSLMGFSLNDFVPPKPDSSVVLTQLIDSLESCLSQVRGYSWIGDANFVNELDGYLTNAKNNLYAGNQIGCARQVRIFQQAVDKEYRDSINLTPAFVTVEGWKFLYYNAQYILDRLPLVPPTGCNIKLVNSTGSKLTGGSLQYYEGSWKDATNNQDGTFSIDTKLKTLSLRMTYAYGTQTKSNVTVGYDTVVFQTVNAQIQLQNSSGTLIDTGSVQYYAGAWRTLGTTTNGLAAKELLPSSYSFRMTYAYASKDKQQDIGTNATVVFQTVNAAVQLQNSQGALMPAPLGDQGTVQYYSGAWRDLGTTTNGVANKELLPNNYSFRMTYAYASKDKQQDIGTNSTIVFQTVNAAVQLQNSQGALMPAPLGDQGTVQYYSGAWRDLGTTTNGIANKELLPNNYSFRMTYAFASKDKQQDIGTNATVVFQTVNAAVQLKNSLGNLIDQGTVQYYSGAWRDLGITTNGVAKKELLPNNYSFRMTYEYVSLDKAQDISTNNTVSFLTVLCTIRVNNSQNQLVNNALASYYSGAWRQIGNTVNGVITKELFPVNLSFRVKYLTQQQDKQQNLSTNTIVEFTLQ